MSSLPSALAYAKGTCANPDRGWAIDFAGYEYLIEPLNDLAPRMVIQKAAQVGATVMAIVRALWFIDVKRAHTMYLFPTHRGAARFSQGRLGVLLERSAYLRTLFRQVRNAAHLRAGAVNLYCHGSRSRPDLLSTPVQYLTLDERDELYLGSLDSPQPWSAVELARQRLSGQREAWELSLSTPTIPGHGIAADFAASDQNHYELFCPHCQRYITPTWPDALQWPADSARWAAGRERSFPVAPASRVGSAGQESPLFICQACGRPWTEAERRGAVRAGRWRPRYPGRPVRGYHLSQLISPAASAAKLADQWLAARDNPAGLQVFYNSVLGLPYVAEGARLEPRCLADAIARGGERMAPSSQGSIMGVDVGPTWLYVVIAEPVGADLRIVWAGKVLAWRQLAEMIRRYRVDAFVIDAQPETHLARDLVRAFPQGVLCYYRGPDSGFTFHAAARTLSVSRTESLDAMYLRWRAGKVIAPADLPAEFAEHLRALVRVVRIGRDGQPVADYVEAGGPDHYAHARNYCELALRFRGRPLVFEVTVPARDGTPAWAG